MYSSSLCVVVFYTIYLIKPDISAQVEAWVCVGETVALPGVVRVM